MPTEVQAFEQTLWDAGSAGQHLLCRPFSSAYIASSHLEKIKPGSLYDCKARSREVEACMNSASLGLGGHNRELQAVPSTTHDPQCCRGSAGCARTLACAQHLNQALGSPNSGRGPCWMQKARGSKSRGGFSRVALSAYKLLCSFRRDWMTHNYRLHWAACGLTGWQGFPCRSLPGRHTQISNLCCKPGQPGCHI